MNIQAHVSKAEAIERSLARLTPADYEMVIEACMLAGTHWFNLILHAGQVFPPEQDAMHAEFMTVADRRKASVISAAALDAMDAIEAMRTTHVRGDLSGGEAAARLALERLEVVRMKARSFLA